MKNKTEHVEKGIIMDDGPNHSRESMTDGAQHEGCAPPVNDYLSKVVRLCLKVQCIMDQRELTSDDWADLYASVFEESE